MSERNCDSISEHLVGEIEAMIIYLSGSGSPLPSGALVVLARIEAGEQPGLPEIGQAHAALAEAVAPALPRTLVLLSEHRPPEAKRSGLAVRSMFALPLTYKFIVISLIALAVVVVLSAVGAESTQPDPSLPWAGVPMIHGLLIGLYIVATACLGGAFNILWTANSYVTRGTYDPRHDASYLIRFVMGIISGVLLAGICREQLSSDDLDKFPIGLLALVGGFSASLLYRFLQRSVTAVESLLNGDMRDAITQAQEQARAKASAAVQTERLKLQNQLHQLRALSEADPTQTKQAIDQLLAGLQGMSGPETARGAATPEPRPAPESESESESESEPESEPAPESGSAPAPTRGWRRPGKPSSEP
ncbi:hypothetical protein ACNOYE_30965 [Nannocystaceae bacterium ST9]